MIARLLISPSLEVRVKVIEEELKKQQLSKTHPDVYYFKTGDKLGIAEAKKIKAHFSLKPFAAEGRGAVLEDASALTAEAQNALLKTLEELPKNAVLILGADSDANFLPTVLSRCQIIKIQSSPVSLREAGRAKFKVPRSRSAKRGGQNYEEEIEKLLNSTMAERFEYVEKLKDKQQFLFSLTSYFHQRLPANTEFLKKLLQAEEWVKQNVNIRAILEYLMLVIPAKKC